MTKTTRKDYGFGMMKLLVMYDCMIAGSIGNVFVCFVRGWDVEKMVWTAEQAEQTMGSEQSMQTSSVLSFSCASSIRVGQERLQTRLL